MVMCAMRFANRCVHEEHPFAKAIFRTFHCVLTGDACRFDGYFQPDLQMKKSLLSQC